MRRGGALHLLPFPGPGMRAAIDDDALLVMGELEGERAGMGAAVESMARRHTAIDQRNYGLIGITPKLAGPAAQAVPK